MKEVSTCGTGNNEVRLPKDVMVKWNNIPIHEVDAWRFAEAIGFGEVEIVFSNRRTKRRWGSCKWWFNNRPPKLLIYRHSVWVFLHEFAHAITHLTYGLRASTHGPEFGSTLTMLYDRWANWAPQNLKPRT